ncbi:mitochondrial amidoxime-reducing component 1 isoform X2 [Acanthopagrus latus]|uniref:mitochondrial amidoxime-reducing component 1 isoform X2 n=1 Tax=Acanthopagrus latus TaxID=8177 RepID=UPI00187C50CB|nr:mitochondrial amidoxime-reducing component 1 isoform X2 [Acanthopagrus latus]
MKIIGVCVRGSLNVTRRASPCESSVVVQKVCSGCKMDLKALVVDALAQRKTTALLIGGAGVAFLGFGLGYKYLRKPEKLVRVGVVSQLLIHPLKSGRAASVALAECQKFGLKFGELQDRVFGDNIQGRDCGDEASRWLTDYLGTGQTFRLVHFEPQMKARLSVETEPLFPKSEQVAYPDVGPVMLLSESSVKDLSSKLEKDVTVERFRPNIVISDCQAFEEDSWEELQIGSVRLQRVMSCGRCVFTTVDPETGVISRKEPLETLKSYRLCKPSEKHIYKSAPLFGQLHVVKQTGILQVGDVVYQIIR